jgi:hypothetical protein
MNKEYYFNLDPRGNSTISLITNIKRFMFRLMI